jgi:hypothetical protein
MGPRYYATQMVDATVRSPMARVGFALTSFPFILLVALAVLAPGYLDPLFANPPAIAGLPLGVAWLFVAIVWAVLGILVARGVRSSARIIGALLVFTLPASMAIILGPAAILIVQNVAI